MNGMRAAVKSAALGGYHSIGLFAGRAAVAAGLRASHPAIATVSVEGGPSMPIFSLDKGSQEASPVLAVQKPWWEEEAVAHELLYPAPRHVFGPVPTLEEAKEATSDLVDTFKEMYPSPIPSHSSTEVPHALFQREARAVVSSIPRHIAQTFALLQGSPEVQNAVASIVADEKVWEAVMSNPQVKELYETHASKVSMVDEDCKSSTAEPTKTSRFKVFIRRAKDKMVEVAINISTFMQDSFDPSKTGSSEEGKSFANSTFRSSLMTLAIATIMVIILKRILASSSLYSLSIYLHRIKR